MRPKGVDYAQFFNGTENLLLILHIVSNDPALFLHSCHQNDLRKLRREYQIVGFHPTEGAKIFVLTS